MTVRAVSIAFAIGLAVGPAPMCHAEPRVDVTWIDARAFPIVSATLVVSQDGSSITGLSPKQFTVDDGRDLVGVTSVTSAFEGDTRLAVALLVDASGSMKGKPLEEAAEAARDLVARLSTGDLVTAGLFTDLRPSLPAPSSDYALAVELFGEARPGGNTAIWDSVTEAVSTLSPSERTRKAIVLLTDGKDTASKSSRADCEEAARNAGIAVYCIGLGEGASREELDSLAAATGGQSYRVPSADSLGSVYQAIAHDLQGDYTVV